MTAESGVSIKSSVKFENVVRNGQARTQGGFEGVRPNPLFGWVYILRM